MTTALHNDTDTCHISVTSKVLLIVPSEESANTVFPEEEREKLDLTVFVPDGEAGPPDGTYQLALVHADCSEACGPELVSRTPAILVTEKTVVVPPSMAGSLLAPLDRDSVQLAAALARDLQRLQRQNSELRGMVRGSEIAGELLGNSVDMRRLRSALSRAAGNDATVLIEGPAGSGRTHCAQLIHGSSRRGSQPMVEVFARDVDAEGMAAQLHQAQGTTLLLESVEELPAQAQADLVRFLKDRAIDRQGFPRREDVRLVVTTSVRLPEQVAAGRFREDLFYRLNAFPLRLPALAQRRDDVPVLAQHFAAETSLRGEGPAFTPSAMVLLESHPWQGNVGQLRSVIQRAMVLAGGGPIDRVHLLGPGTGISAPEINPMAMEDTQDGAADQGEDVDEEDIRPLEEEEQRLLTRALQATKGNVRRAAQLLGIGRATLYRKIQIYKLKLH